MGMSTGRAAGLTDADLIAAAVRSTPTVADLSGGPYGEGTYLPGRRVLGVRVGEAVEIHVVGRYGVTVATIAADVRRSVRPLVGDRPVHVVIEDLAWPEHWRFEQSTASSRASIHTGRNP